MKEKAKKYMVVAGGTVICAALVFAIGMQSKKAPVKTTASTEESTVVAEIVVDPGQIASDMTESEGAEEQVTEPAPETEPEETKLVIQPTTEVVKETKARPVDTRPAQTNQTEQAIQPEVTKPAALSEEALKDPTTKPDGTKLTEPPVPVEHDAVVPPQTDAAPDQPQAGDTSNDQIYIPGFGWVDNQGGGGSGTVAEDMYENGNKIGAMD